MFIELTDHLRCLAAHDEAYLVLLPDRMEGRDVRTGHLGCPVCGWSAEVAGGILDYGGADAPTGPSALTAPAVATFLGLGGPGGFVGLAGLEGALLDELAGLLPGIHLAVVNPPTMPDPETPASILRAPRLPLKQASMRGVVLAGGLAERDDWIRDAVRAVLPGLRVVVEGPAREMDGVTLLAGSPSVWVGVKR
jgi:hypothetical protein